MIKAGLRALATHLPATELTNAQLVREWGGTWDEEKILAKTGVAKRHVAGPGECASDLGVAAAQRLFAQGACAPADVDFLLFCTQAPDYPLPTTACLMQDRLGLRQDCGALDFNLGCSGFVYGLALARGLIETQAARRVLLVTADTYTKYVHPRDRSARTLFGDGAAATLIEAVETQEEPLGAFVFGTDGAGGKHLIVPAGGWRQPATPETAVAREMESGNWRAPQNLYMNGPEIFTFTLRVVPETVRECLRRARLSVEQVDYFVFHQASLFMLDHLRRKIGLPEEKFCLCLREFGNTVSSTIPMALEQALRQGRIGPGSRVMLVGFGVGLSWAAAMVTLMQEREA